MIEEVKVRAVEREKICLERIAALEETNKKLMVELNERKRFPHHSNEKHDQYQNLKSVNNELYQKLEELVNSSEVARERFKLLEEWEHWKKYREREGSEEVKKLEIEFEEQKRLAKKYKSEYLKAKKEAKQPLVKGSEESSEGSASSTASPGVHYVGDRKLRPQYKMNRGEYGARQITNTRVNPP